MVTVEWGHGPLQRSVREDELDELLDRISSDARQDGRPQDVQVTVEGAGTLGIVVGADWSVLNYVPQHLNPPYMISVGQEQSEDPVAFYVAGDHHSEALRRNTIKTEAARAAMRHFAASGSLSPDVDWGEV
jgi:Immunity protein Imm1